MDKLNLAKEREYAYSEIFFSIQGEGKYTGMPTVWLRYFLCNLQCNGFGQKDPTDPKTYVLPYQDLDVSKYKSMEELPVLAYGCDSSYSWAKKFKSLTRKGTPAQIADRMRESMRSDYNKYGNFTSPATTQPIHACFTGGEPLMKHGQECTIQIIEHWLVQKDAPDYITFETNGTQELTSEFYDYFEAWQEHAKGELFMSISPKLWTVAGEKPAKAIFPEVVAEYRALTPNGQLKFVSNGTRECWAEIEETVRRFRNEGVNYPIWIMPVGANVEGQNGDIGNGKTAGDIAAEAFHRGYNVAGRMHVYLWNNLVGV
jgi:organic radical activating enzyme